MSTKQQLQATFSTYATTAVQRVDDEWTLVGKFCRAAPMDNGLLDVWVCNPKDMVKGLGTRKLNILIDKTIAQTGVSPAIRWDGEALFHLSTPQLAMVFRELGIRKRRVGGGNPEALAEWRAAA